MERYEVYRDSGVEWIGEIPEKWEVVPLKALFSFGKGLPITKADLLEEGEPVISYGQIHSKANTPAHIKHELVRYVSPSFLESNAASITHKGDFLFADTSEDVEGSGNFVFHDLDERVFAGYHTLILRPTDVSYGRYLSYLFQDDQWKAQIRSRVSGVKLFSLTLRILTRASLLLPSAEEQQAIADYLDAKTAEIDALVADCEREVGLLREYRKAVISEAVTKGLDPTVPMKDSGVKWIGEIPDHWNAGKLLRHARLESGHTPSRLHPEWWLEEECTIPWITTQDVHRFRDGQITCIDDTELHISQIGLENSSARWLPAGTVALSRTASVGFSIVLSIPMASSQDFADWIPDESLDSFYLLYTLRSMDMVFKQLQMGSTHKTIYMPDIMNRLFPRHQDRRNRRAHQRQTNHGRQAARIP